MNKWQKRGPNLEFLTIDVHPKSLLSLKIMMWGSDMILLHKFFGPAVPVGGSAVASSVLSRP